MRCVLCHPCSPPLIIIKHDQGNVLFPTILCRRLESMKKHIENEQSFSFFCFKQKIKGGWRIWTCKTKGENRQMIIPTSITKFYSSPNPYKLNDLGQ